MPGFNQQIKQLLILSMLIALILLSIVELRIFLPGLLGALTLYILSRASYFQLVYYRKWKKGWTAGLFLIGYILMLCLLIYVVVILLGPKIQQFLDDPAMMISAAKKTLADLQQKTGYSFITEDELSAFLHRLSGYLPKLINDTMDLILNLVIMLFFLYYMLVHGKEMEQYIGRIIPLKQTNIDILASETKRIVKASALGIPLISIIQGLAATLGYFLFGIDDFVLWGFITGVFAFFPVIGTMLIWVPLVISVYAGGDTWNATWLFFYSAIVTGNVDYLARITLLKRMGNIHPVITVLGVLVGLGLFGFIGLIFGPLLVNYIVLLFRIYSNEFIENNPDS
jgi:predicted PurR-regulated permease PerM